MFVMEQNLKVAQQYIKLIFNLNRMVAFLTLRVIKT